MPTLPKNDFAERVYHEEHDPSYLIIKGNPLVQRTRYGARMPLDDMKVLASLIRTIKPNQHTLTVRFNTRRFVHMLGLQNDSNNFNHIMATIKHIANDSFWFKRQDGKYQLWSWISTAIADPLSNGDGVFLVKFEPYLRRFLFLKKHSYETIYKFSDIMLMRSRYSPRLYEIFRSNQSRQKVQKRGLNYSIAELKFGLDLMHYNHRTDKIRHDKNGKILFMYPRYADFKRDVIVPAAKEINKYTEYNIRIRPLKPHRKIVGFNVAMLKKNKKELEKRDSRIFFHVHHIPKAKQPYWREDMKHRGHFYRVNRRRRKSLPPKYKREGPSSKHYSNMHQVALEAGKKRPFRAVNMSGDMIEYYNPLVRKLYWSSSAVRDQFKKTYELLHRKPKGPDIPIIRK